MKKITVRPCKEKPGMWEIMGCNGNVLNKHYHNKEEAVSYANTLAHETASELVIEE